MVSGHCHAYFPELFVDRILDLMACHIFGALTIIYVFLPYSLHFQHHAEE